MRKKTKKKLFRATLIRIPQKEFKTLQRLSKRNHSSINHEINSIIKQSYLITNVKTVIQNEIRSCIDSSIKDFIGNAIEREFRDNRGAWDRIIGAFIKAENTNGS